MADKGPNRYQVFSQSEICYSFNPQNNYDISDFVGPPPSLLAEDGAGLLTEDGSRIGLDI